MAEAATEIERLLVRLVGDNKMYVQTLQEAQKLTQQYVQGVDGKFRDLQGRFVSAQVAMQASAAATVQKLAGYGAALSNIGNIAQSVGAKMKSLGFMMSLKVTAPLTAAGLAGAKTFMDFETVLSQMQGLAGVGAQEIAGITQSIRELSSETGKGPTELAKGLYNIRSSGLSGQVALDTLTASAKAASAGLGETKVVSDAVTSVLNAYGTATMKASDVTDILVAAVREGKAEADELAPVMGRLVPVASSMGIKFNEVAGIMAVMSRTGLDAAEASVSVGAVLSTLQKPSVEATKLLQEHGLSMASLRDVAKKPGGLIEVMRILERTFGDNEEALAAIVPNVRAFRGLMNVLSQDAATVDQVMKAVAESSGATEEAFAAGAGTLGRAWEQTKASIQTALIELGDAIAPVLLKLTEHIKSVTQWFANLDQGTQTLLVQIGALAAATAPVLLVFGMLTSAIGGVISIFGRFLQSVTLVSAALKALQVATGLLSKVGMAGLVVGVAAAAYALGTKFSPHAQKAKKDLEDLNRASTGLAAVFDRRFSASMEGLANLPVDKQAQQLNQMRKNLEDQMQGALSDVGRYKEEIATLNDQNFLSRTLDAQGIALAEGHLESARQRVEQLKTQLDTVDSAMKNLGGSAGPGIEDPTIEARPQAIAEFSKQIEEQLRNLEIEHGGISAGLTEGQIQRRQAAAAFEAELAEIGATVNDQEKERLNLLDRQMTHIEKMMEARDKEKKLQEEMVRKQKQEQEQMAQKARQILEDQLTPLQRLRQEIDEVNKLQQGGALTAQEAAAARNKAVADFATQENASKATAGQGIRFGSVESEIMRSQRTDMSTEKGVWKLVAQTDVNIRTQNEILEAIKANTPPEVVSIP